MAPLTAQELQDLRSGVESEHNAIRDAREKQYVDDKVELEAVYQSDLRQIRLDKEEAMRTAGLNSDGSDPQGRQQV